MDVFRLLNVQLNPEATQFFILDAKPLEKPTSPWGSAADGPGDTAQGSEPVQGAGTSDVSLALCVAQVTGHAHLCSQKPKGGDTPSVRGWTTDTRGPLSTCPSRQQNVTQP